MQKMVVNKIAEAVTNTASKYPCINRVGIFGSYARGDYCGNSDVDLLYDYDYNQKDSTEQFLSFVEDFLNIVKPLDADFVFIDNLLESKDGKFKQNVLNDVLWVYMKTLSI